MPKCSTARDRRWDRRAASRVGESPRSAGRSAPVRGPSGSSCAACRDRPRVRRGPACPRRGARTCGGSPPRLEARAHCCGSRNASDRTVRARPTASASHARGRGRADVARGGTSTTPGQKSGSPAQPPADTPPARPHRPSSAARRGTHGHHGIVWNGGEDDTATFGHCDVGRFGVRLLDRREEGRRRHAGACGPEEELRGVPGDQLVAVDAVVLPEHVDRVVLADLVVPPEVLAAEEDDAVPVEGDGDRVRVRGEVGKSRASAVSWTMYPMLRLMARRSLRSLSRTGWSSKKSSSFRYADRGVLA